MLASEPIARAAACANRHLALARQAPARGLHCAYHSRAVLMMMMTTTMMLAVASTAHRHWSHATCGPAARRPRSYHEAPPAVVGQRTRTHARTYVSRVRWYRISCYNDERPRTRLRTASRRYRVGREWKLSVRTMNQRHSVPQQQCGYEHEPARTSVPSRAWQRGPSPRWASKKPSQQAIKHMSLVIGRVHLSWRRT